MTDGEFVHTVFVVSREFDYEGEAIIGVAESLAEAESVAAIQMSGDVEHIREFAGTEVMLHVVKRRKYRRTPTDARGCYTSEFDGYTDWMDANAER